MIEVRPVGYIVGWLVVVLGLLMVAPMLLDFADGSLNSEGFALAAVMTILGGASVAAACANSWEGVLDLRQGFLLTTGSWTIFPAVCALPMMLGAPDLDFTDAYFEGMSAMTTTGATVIAGLDHLPRGLLLWRGMLQWVGGIGIVLMAIILLPVLKIGGMQLLRSADFNTLGKVMPRAQEIAFSLGAVYLALTLACLLAYVWCGMSTFDAVVHAMTTLSSGGMGNYDSSFSGFSPAAQYVATVFMLLGAMSFTRFVQVTRGNVEALFRDTQIRWFLVTFAGFSAAILLARVMAEGEFDELSVREVLFNVASLLTSTGYATTNYTLWGSLAVTLVFCINMVGGCSGSTAGGVKIFRYQLLLAKISAEVKRLYSPNIVILARYQGRAVSDQVLDSVAAFFMMYFLSLGVVSVVLVLLGLTPITAISGAATALANIGPGLGDEIGPAGNFAGLPGAAKWVLSFAMLIGRLELMAVFVLLLPSFWRD